MSINYSFSVSDFWDEGGDFDMAFAGHIGLIKCSIQKKKGIVLGHNWNRINSFTAGF